MMTPANHTGSNVMDPTTRPDHDADANDADANGGGANDAGAAPVDASKLDEIIATRRAKVATMREAGIDPYPVRCRPTATIAAIRERYGALEAGDSSGEIATVAGRVIGRRQMGKLQFLVIREDGHDLQLLCMKGRLDEAALRVLELTDIGDWLAASGEVICSKTGELSVQPTSLTMLGKIGRAHV